VIESRLISHVVGQIPDLNPMCHLLQKARAIRRNIWPNEFSIRSNMYQLMLPDAVFYPLESRRSCGSMRTASGRWRRRSGAVTVLVEAIGQDAEAHHVSAEVFLMRAAKMWNQNRPIARRSAAAVPDPASEFFERGH